MCLFLGSNFSGSHCKLRKPSYTFTGFHHRTHIYNKKILGLSSEGVSIPACYYPTHIFIFIYTTVRPCWTLSHRTEPTQSNTNSALIITIHSHPFNAMSPCICNAMRHFMLYHATCIMNATWTLLKPYTSLCTMDNYINQDKISK